MPTQIQKQIEEAIERFREQVKKLVKENVRYIVSDPSDIRVGILAQEQIEDWVVSLCKTELKNIATKSAEFEREKIEKLINSTKNDIEKLDLVVKFLNGVEEQS